MTDTLKQLAELQTELDTAKKDAATAKRAMASICKMLGWLNMPPVHLVEFEIAALKRKAAENAALDAERQRMREALENLLGIYDTPIARLKMPPDEFMQTALQVARKALTGETP